MALIKLDWGHGCAAVGAGRKQILCKVLVFTMVHSRHAQHLPCQTLPLGIREAQILFVYHFN